MLEKTIHKKFMQTALGLARKGLGRTKTNPCVGCVIVKNGKIIGRGFHEGFGKSHAEINALNKAGKKAHGSTLYVTLEPCSHSGKGKKTPPCIPKIIERGIKKIVIAMKDPNPKVNGKGIHRLKKAEIEMGAYVCEKEARELNKGYIKWITTGMPYAVQKIGMSANGIIWSEELKGKWINGKEAKEWMHELRNELDGVLVGVRTVIHDNPKLTCRMKRGRNPVRIVLDPKLEIPINAKLLLQAGKTILVIGTQLKEEKLKKKKLQKKYKEKIRFLSVPVKEGLFNLNRVFKELGRQNLTGILVEGGQTLNSSMLKEKLADRVVFIVSPIEFQTGTYFIDPEKTGKLNLKLERIQTLGNDALIVCKN